MNANQRKEIEHKTLVVAFYFQRLNELTKLFTGLKKMDKKEELKAKKLIKSGVKLTFYEVFFISLQCLDNSAVPITAGLIVILQNMGEKNFLKQFSSDKFYKNLFQSLSEK